MINIVQTEAARRQIERLGFRRLGRRDQDRYQLNGYSLVIQDGWLTVSSSDAPRNRAELLGGGLGGPGLWRWVGDPRGPRVFEMPHHVLAATESTGAGEPTDDPVSACLEWAMKTASGRPPKKWSPPPVEAIDELIPEGAATVRAGDVVRQCVVERAEHRLSLRCPIVLDVREDLPVARRRWLERIVLESQAQWRMVRVGFEDRALVAETDLTGAPIDAGLVHAAIDAMCSVIGWLAGPADLIAGTVESETLKIDPASWTS